MLKRRQHHFKFLFLIGLIFAFLLNLLLIWRTPAAPAVVPESVGRSYKNSDKSRLHTSSKVEQAILLGKNYYSLGDYTQAIATWLRALELSTNAKEKAAIHSEIGATYRQIGKLSEAIQQWKKAAGIYQNQKEPESRHALAAVLADQAQTYNALGNSRLAVLVARQAIDLGQKYQQPQTEAVAQGALGNAYAITGDYEQALSAYQASLKLATALNDSDYIVTALNNQVNVLDARSQRFLAQAASAQREKNTQEQERLFNLAKQDQDAAKTAASRALQQSRTIGGIHEVRALFNLTRFSEEQDLITDYQRQALAILEKLPDSRSKAYALIQLSEVRKGLTTESKIKILEQAVTVAQHIGDSHTESFALGALGHIYELSGQLTKAMELTSQAQFAAQQENAFDSLYHWQWQAGRIHKATGSLEEAIASYKQAIATLQTIRGDIATANQNLQFDIRDLVEPIYRQLMALLLENKQDKSSLEEVLRIADLLKLSELQNFFGDECLEISQAISKSQSNIAKNNDALIYSIILDRQTFMILKLPDGTLKSYPIKVSSGQLKSEIDKLRLLLGDFGSTEYTEPSRKIYELIIRPMIAELARAKPSSLVFISDGVLRNIPMAALHDGQQFLIEKYPVSTSLNLNSVSSNKTKKESALIFGLSVKIPPFSNLPYVKVETQAVQNIIGGKKFINKDFTLAKLHTQIQKKGYPIIHLATHGEFGGTADTTFLQAYDGRISLKDFEVMLAENKGAVDLITLSACQTAAGDDRATLGLAGLAVRNGVKNVLASLWAVNDADVVPLIENFYTELRQPNTSPAEALRNAQLKLISDFHPSVWSSFVLVNN